MKKFDEAVYVVKSRYSGAPGTFVRSECYKTLREARAVARAWSPDAKVWRLEISHGCVLWTYDRTYRR